MGILNAFVSVRKLKESSVTGDATGAPLSFQSGISSSKPRGSNTFPAWRPTTATTTKRGHHKNKTRDYSLVSKNKKIFEQYPSIERKGTNHCTNATRNMLRKTSWSQATVRLANFSNWTASLSASLSRARCHVHSLRNYLSQPAVPNTRRVPLVQAVIFYIVFNAADASLPYPRGCASRPPRPSPGRRR